MLGKIKIALGLIAMSVFPMVHSTQNHISGVIIYNLLYRGKVNLKLSLNGIKTFDIWDIPRKVHEDCTKDCVYEIDFQTLKTFRFNSEGVYFEYLGQTLNISYNLNESIRGQSDIKDCNYYVLQFETKFEKTDE
ncbi:hypothetical protein BB559_000093 [Furculomyces boomerangus]|uniref:Uncharacterized protein n=2 Tax=Harpellales TaxID=61421 RepID=A0A2T9Z6E4_9FUNG|nr:hypothetical protein BB559_000093 [Furculomyces boomerangus]PWA00576.1 hypothetical protein BB558_003388 [Smittium angustum]